MAQVGSLAIRDVALDYPAGGGYERGSDARLRMVVVNGGIAPDALVSVSSPVATDATISAGRGGRGDRQRDAGADRQRASETASPTATPSDTASAGRRHSVGGARAGRRPRPRLPPRPAAPTPENAQIQIPPNSYVSFREDGPRIMLTGLTRQLRPGQNLRSR